MKTINFKPGDKVSCYLGVGVVESIETNKEKIHVVLSNNSFLMISASKLKLIG